MATETTVLMEQVSSSASRGVARNHTLMCDRPEDKGGSNQGPMGGELFLMGFGGCFMSNLLAAIEARSGEVSGVRIELRGVLDGTPVHFTEIELLVSATYQDRAEMEKLLVIAERGCIVANTIKEAVRLKISLR